MAHYAKVKNGRVEDVLVAEQDYIDSLPSQDGVVYIQTSYNTHAGVHTSGGTPLRKNYAGVGFQYDAQRDAFIPPKPFASWLLNESTCRWEPPVAKPNDGRLYVWDEASVSWKSE